MFGAFGRVQPEPEDPPEPPVSLRDKPVEVDQDVEKILKWREKKLVDAGLPLGEASILAAARLDMGYVDTELIKKLHAQGCPPETLVKILV